MSASEFPEIDFAEIKRWLERSDRRELEKEFRITPKYLSAILSGRKRNMEVIQKALNKAMERKAIVASMNRLKQLS